MRRTHLLIGAAALLTAFLALKLSAGDPPKPQPISEIPERLKAYAEKMLEVSKTYQRFGRVDDEQRWAPFDCRMPNPAKAQFSGSSDEATHGRKLYSLLAKDRREYVQHAAQAAAGKPVSVGQIIVKESWHPEQVELTGEPKPVVRRLGADEKRLVDPFDTFLPYAKKDGKWYKAAKFAGLFVMMKVDPKTPDSDDGWVYGTVDADRKRVTAVGRIESCMECHQKAKHDRLFGPAAPVR